MKAEVKAAFVKFGKWICSLPGKIFSILKDSSAPDSPYSSRRVAMLVSVAGGAYFGIPGITAAIEIAKTSDSTTGAVLKCLVPLVPFLVCAFLVYIIVMQITKSDITATIEKFKEK